MTAQPSQDRTTGRLLYRYASGRPLDGRPRTDGGYLRRGRSSTSTRHASAWARRPGWQRQAWRLGVPTALCGAGTAYTAYPTVTAAIVVAAAAVGTGRAGRWLRAAWRTRSFRAAYIRPVLAALAGALGDAPVRLHVDPSLGSLVPRLARPMSPAEVAVRARYGQHVEPALRWLPGRAMRAVWALRRAARPATRHLAVFRVPRTDAGPRIELSAAVPFLTAEQRQYVSAVIKAKIPAGADVEAWDQVGTRVTATWTVRKRPPARVGYADLAARLDTLEEWQFFLGLGVDRKPVVISLRDDSPHVAVSASTGAGKSVLAQLIAIQVLCRGGLVVVLDRKGSHGWAVGLPGVIYCRTAAQMHPELVRLGALADVRNDRAFTDPAADIGARILIVAEELNATFDLLRDYWEEIREKGEPKKSPAVKGLHGVLFMGRSAKINAVGIAQMLTARAIGGPEARECFSIRCLARYSTNAWKMLVPEAAMPRASRTLGRWQIVVGGVATECQVAYLTAAEARLLVTKHTGVSPGTHSPLMGADQHLSPGQAPGGDITDPLSERVTLRQAIDRGITSWSFAAAKKRLQRARNAGSTTVPVPAGKVGQADVYRVGDLIVWIESEMITLPRGSSDA